ncbi:MAG: ribosome small subunit-dependent GTPase A [Ignavibacteriota bacterium]
MSTIEQEDQSSSERIRRSNADRSRKKDVKHPERHSVKDIGAAEESSGFVKGRVITSEGANFIVSSDDGQEYRARSIKSTRSGNENSSLVVVGDIVLIEPGDQDISVVREVLPRKTRLSRKAHKRRDNFEQVIAANIDILAVVMSAGDPPFQNGILDKYIIAGHEGGLDILIVLNKTDELEGNSRRNFINEVLGYYAKIGYDSARTSIITGDGIDDLKKKLEGKIGVFAGKSGVGKSSLVNALLGREVASTRELTRKEQRGVHTTTNASLLQIDESATSFIVDTPGIREFFHFDLDPDNIKFDFKDFLIFQEDCSMTNCMHIHEPGCAVIEALDEGLIPEWRYNSYMGLWEEAERERKLRASGI